MLTETTEELQTQAIPQTEAAARSLPSGRSVVVRVGRTGEEIEVRSPEGDVEVRICLTAAGPVVQLRGARLELESAESMDVRCQRFTVEADEVDLHCAGNIHMQAQGELRIRTEEATHINGKMINLNC
jgi:hypothetical protein